ncbi:MAG: ion transporter [Cyanothece sp. SIO1E1]|nr:ion transporter [Cyanothece sp. SIO1E1]
MLLRQKITVYLEDVETPTGRGVNLAIAGLIALSSAIFVAETYPLSADMEAVLEIIDLVILVIFVVEYLVRFWIADNKLQYCLSLYSLIDLVAIVPFFLGFVDIRFIRLFRWLRILRLIRFLERHSLITWIRSEDRIIFARILFTLFAIIFVYSGLIYQVEHPINAEKFSTFLDAFYFSVVTMTTVGFGDVIPTSDLGRWLTVLMILTGIALIPWQLGDLAKRLLKAVNQIETTCSTCRLSFHDSDAQFCKICGTPLIRLDVNSANSRSSEMSPGSLAHPDDAE